MEENPYEIVVIDFHHVDDAICLLELHRELEEILGPQRLVPASAGVHITVDEMWQTPRRALVFVDGVTPQHETPLIWDKVMMEMKGTTIIKLIHNNPMWFTETSKTYVAQLFACRHLHNSSRSVPRPVETGFAT